MQPNTILQSDILDIIFERRNKNYGAYTLRKYYDKRLVKSLGLMLLFATGVLSLFFLQKDETGLRSIPTLEVVTGFFPVTPENKKEAPKPPVKPKQPTAMIKTSAQASSTIIKFVDKTTSASPLLNPDSINLSNTNPLGVPGGKPFVNVPSGPGTTPPGLPGEVKKIDKNIPISSPEIMPSFPGGEAALREFLKKNLVTPDIISQGETVSVKARFIVGYDGTIKGIEITEDGGEIFNEEVVRVLKKMPKWNPGKTKGENVSVYYSIPIKFIGQE